MSKYIINLLDGTVCGATDSVIVDVDALNDEGTALWHEWLDGGSDSTATELGMRFGVDLQVNE